MAKEPARTPAQIEFETLSNNVRRLRQSTGLSQRKFGAIANFGQAEISKLETMQQEPNLSTLARLSARFQKRAYTLLLPDDMDSRLREFLMHGDLSEGAFDRLLKQFV